LFRFIYGQIVACIFGFNKHQKVSIMPFFYDIFAKKILTLVKKILAAHEQP